MRRVSLVLVGFAMVVSHGAGALAAPATPGDSARVAYPDSSVAESLGVAPAESVTPPADTTAALHDTLVTTPAVHDTLVTAPARRDTLVLAPVTRADTAATRRPTWALALAGGVARGLAYSGTFRVLDAEGLRPNLVAGSSMGALMAALYAAGYPGADIQRLCDSVDWGQALSPSSTERREWRDWRIPGPWVKLDDRTGKLGMLPGLLNDAAINHMLASQLLECDALARGDFDRLMVPLRVVATDLNTMTPVSLRDGSIAQAVRLSIGLPVIFPAMVRDGRTLGDGGFSSNLPILAAREPGIDHVLAVDVALPQPRLDAESPAALVGITLLDKLNKRGQFDTLQTGDRYVWIRMPGISAYDFGAIDTMAALGAEDTRAQLAGWPDSLGLTRGLERPGPPDPVLAPLAGPPRFVHEDGTETRLASTARHVMGHLPAGPFRPGELRPGLEKLYQAGLFTSAWPRFEGNADSTRLVFQVAEEARREARFTAAADNDRGARAQGSLLWRPTPFGAPSVATVAGTIRSFDWNLFGSLEPHRLDRGSPGWFVRGGLRRVMTRVFDAPEDWTREYNDQSEAMLGSQLPRLRGISAQAGVGYAAYKEAGVTNRGVLGAVELQSSRGLLESARWTGMSGPGRFSAFTVDAHLPMARGMWTLSPGFHGGWASSGTPLMELPAIGGPTHLGGFREDEWSGRTALAGELRLILAPSPFFEAHGAAQLAGVRDPVSRADLSGRMVGALTIGLRVSTPFGPLALDYGIADSEQHRVDVRFGSWF
ncbi:MAG TPA: patatin-like phospholipase family protein [Dongiaceae bacterium]|nr:patatin-like phospholipase family protein [Dongiaceae bacterium]